MGKVHFTTPNYPVCLLKPLNKISTQFIPLNYLSWSNSPPNKICHFCFSFK
uniref:Uncharacterized protein n=1 Tax=Arundo donax TaxID=35708 RepID=A0A0A9H0D5_ARUDO